MCWPVLKSWEYLTDNIYVRGSKSLQILQEFFVLELIVGCGMTILINLIIDYFNIPDYFQIFGKIIWRCRYFWVVVLGLTQFWLYIHISVGGTEPLYY